MLKKIILPLWIFAAISLLFYSFTQIDLSLTLSQASFWQVLQKNFQQIGWFNRPLSTYLYIGIVGLLFALYLATIKFVSSKKINQKTLWIIIVSVALVLLPSYNAFSYDMFNYIFDARIVSNYHLNPYSFKALDFPSDPILSFMRSTHRVYPYGPSWLVATVPLTFVGGNFFLLTFYLFKTLSVVSFLGSCFFIYKIAEKLKLKNSALATCLFALNPLVIIESLVSAHNETFMMFAALGSVYMLVSGKRLFSIATLVFSIGVKYTTLFLLPLYGIYILFGKKINDRKFIIAAVFLMSLAVIVTSAASGQNKNPEFQPWYLLSLAPFIALLENKFVRTIFISLCFVSLLTYIPYIQNGEWPKNIVELKNYFLVGGGVFGVVSYFVVSKFSSAK